MNTSRILALIAVSLLIACENYPALSAADAPREARRAIYAGDCRLLGVYGFTTETPGAGYEDAQRLGRRLIEGTSDTPMVGAEEAFNGRARRYAALYNNEILARCR